MKQATVEVKSLTSIVYRSMERVLWEKVVLKYNPLTSITFLLVSVLWDSSPRSSRRTAFFMLSYCLKTFNSSLLHIKDYDLHAPALNDRPPVWFLPFPPPLHCILAYMNFHVISHNALPFSWTTLLSPTRHTYLHIFYLYLFKADLKWHLLHEIIHDSHK